MTWPPGCMRVPCCCAGWEGGARASDRVQSEILRLSLSAEHQAVFSTSSHAACTNRTRSLIAPAGSFRQRPACCGMPARWPMADSQRHSCCLGGASAHATAPWCAEAINSARAPRDCLAAEQTGRAPGWQRVSSSALRSGGPTPAAAAWHGAAPATVPSQHAAERLQQVCHRVCAALNLPCFAIIWPDHTCSQA